MRYFIKNKKIQKCLDLRCDILLIDREFLASQSHKIIKRIITSFKMRNIDDREHDTSKYYKFDFYIIEVHNKALVIAHFKRKMHVINDLRTKVLIDTNILELKVIVFDVT